MSEPKNRYTKIIESIFARHYVEGAIEVSFKREDIIAAAKELKIELPKNLGDVLYSFRYRAALPKSISDKASEGYEWVIRPAGRGLYKISLVPAAIIVPNVRMVETKILDATPGLINRYAMGDEQALLAKLRYNRLIDVFTGLTCYSLQSHLRTTIPHVGQVETDEIYIGVDNRGAHFILPVQAKGGKDRLGIVQIEQDYALCSAKFPGLICRAIAAQFMSDDLIALFEFENTATGVLISAERHYRLVPTEGISDEEIKDYARRPA